MSVDAEQLRYILGLKVGRLRGEQGLSLKQVSARSGLSISYLSEIEKGLKYPKPDKLLRLAEGLEVPFDELVSTKLDEGDPLHELLRSPFVRSFPFELFGLQAQNLLDLVRSAPDQGGALVRTFLEVGRSYDVRVEHFLYAALRSWQRMHTNYFDDLERAAAAFRDQQGWRGRRVDEALLRAYLTDVLGYALDERTIGETPDLAGLRSVHLDGSPPRLLIDGRLLPNQQAFAFGREIGYHHLGLTARSAASSPIEVTSFEQVVNDFRAAYFAGALLIERDRLLADVGSLLGASRWRPEAFLELLAKYPATPETLLYRLSQVLPGELGLSEMFFMRFSQPAGGERVILTKNLNMSRVPVPHGVGLNEHYCRRWPGLEILRPSAAPPNGDGVRVTAQRSRFPSDDSTFFVFAVARPLVLTPTVETSISLGFLLDRTFKRRVAFWDDPAVPTVDVGLTCERCPIQDCAVRAAEPELVEHEARQDARRRAVDALRTS